MAETTRELGRAARGGAIALIGLFISSVFGFLTRAVVGRVYGPSDYGAYNVAFTIFNMTLILVLLGFPMTLQRQVSYFREKNPEKTKKLISTALVTVLISAIIGTMFLEVEKDWLAEIFLRDKTSQKTLIGLLAIISIAIPFSAVVNSLISTTQGFKRVREYFLYSRVYQPLIYFIAILTIAVLLRLPVNYTVVGYVLTVFTVLLLLVRDTRRNGILPEKLTFQPELAKLLLSFSIPLMLSGIVGFIMTWTDTLMLGHFRGSVSAGIYNAAAPLARFIPVFLAAFTVIYNPIATGFYARGKMKELNKFYTSITKWILLFTFPLFLLLVTMPSWVLIILFGKDYASASISLSILSVGYMFHTIMGPNGLTLVSIGKPNQEMLGNIIGATLNVIINLSLIPRYGMTGAAIATAVSYVVANTYKSTLLWLYGIRPFNKKYIKIVIFTLITTVILLLVPHNLRLLAFVVASIIFYIIVILTGGLEQIDLELLEIALQKLGMKGNKLITLLDKYVQ